MLNILNTSQDKLRDGFGLIPKTAVFLFCVGFFIFGFIEQAWGGDLVCRDYGE